MLLYIFFIDYHILLFSETSYLPIKATHLCLSALYNSDTSFMFWMKIFPVDCLSQWHNNFRQFKKKIKSRVQLYIMWPHKTVSTNPVQFSNNIIPIQVPCLLQFGIMHWKCYNPCMIYYLCDKIQCHLEGKYTFWVLQWVIRQVQCILKLLLIYCFHILLYMH